MKNLSPLSKWILFGVACYLLIAIFTAPASLIFSFIKNDNFTAYDVSGSAWNGEAGSIRVGEFQANDVRWKFKPLALLTLAAGAEVNAKVPGGSVRGDVKVSLLGNSGTAKRLHGVIKMQEFANSISQPMMLDGKLGLQLESVSWSEQKIDSIHGDVLLGNLVEPITKTEVGSFEVSFPEGGDTPIKGLVSDTAAVFKLNGTIVLQEDGNYQFDGLVQPTQDTSGDVLRAIELMGGSRDREGNYAINMNGAY